MCPVNQWASRGRWRATAMLLTALPAPTESASLHRPLLLLDPLSHCSSDPANYWLGTLGMPTFLSRRPIPISSVKWAQGHRRLSPGCLALRPLSSRMAWSRPIQSSGREVQRWWGRQEHHRPLPSTAFPVLLSSDKEETPAQGRQAMCQGCTAWLLAWQVMVGMSRTEG